MGHAIFEFYGMTCTKTHFPKYLHHYYYPSILPSEDWMVVVAVAAVSERARTLGEKDREIDIIFLYSLWPHSSVAISSADRLFTLYTTAPLLLPIHSSISSSSSHHHRYYYSQCNENHFQNYQQKAMALPSHLTFTHFILLLQQFNPKI